MNVELSKHYKHKHFKCFKVANNNFNFILSRNVVAILNAKWLMYQDTCVYT